MGIRRRARRYRGNDSMAAIAIAFGVGLILALFCSVKLALLVAAIALIYIGCRFKPC